MQPKKLLFSTLGALAVWGVLGCGSDGDRNEVVARVAGVGSITKAAVDHWTRVEFILLHEYVPTRPVPKGVVPDPPSYKDCISYLKRIARAEAVSGQGSAALETKCRESDREMRKNTLTKLISWDWTIGRAHALGIHASDAEVRQQLDRLVKRRQLYGSNLGRYLKLSEQTMADLLLRARLQLFETDLNARATHFLAGLPKGLTEKQKQLAYVNVARQHLAVGGWAAKTSCRKGYVVSGCRQYTGSEALSGGGA